MLKTFSCILLLTLLPLLHCELGVDVSQLFSVQNYTCMKNNGVTFAIARGYCSFGGIDHNAIQSLTNMKAAGLKAGAYMFPCRGKNATAQVNEFLAAVPSNLYDAVWIDVETNPSPGCSWTGHDSASNCQFIVETVRAL
jgi:GH25 family lysozyme M1 (1,4-beta-N-acetylmuramidase)